MGKDGFFLMLRASSAGVLGVLKVWEDIAGLPMPQNMLKKEKRQFLFLL